LRKISLLITALLLFFFSLPTYAFEIWENEDDYKFAFGLEISFPMVSSSLSATYSINDNFAVQGLLGISTEFSGELSGIKAIYRISHDTLRNVYLFGLGCKITESRRVENPQSAYCGVIGIGLEYAQFFLLHSVRTSFEIGYSHAPLPGRNSHLILFTGARIYF
jgi:hypothetical protein